MNEDGLSPGTRMGLRLGYDILNNLSLDAFLLANFNQGLLKADDLAAGVLSGDLAHFAPGIGLRFAFITTDHWFVFARAAEPGVVFGSKAVGEPPLMLALSAREALRAAVAAFGDAPRLVALPSPATPESVYFAIEAVRQKAWPSAEPRAAQVVHHPPHGPDR